MRLTRVWVCRLGGGEDLGGGGGGEVLEGCGIGGELGRSDVERVVGDGGALWRCFGGCGVCGGGDIYR